MIEVQCNVNGTSKIERFYLGLQWVLHMKWASPIFAVRGSDALFPNDFGEDFV